MNTEKDRLYFIRLLIEAWESEDREAALLETLREIRRLGQKASHKEDYTNFLRFMEGVEEQMLADPASAKSHFRYLLENILTAIVTDTWEGSPEDRDAILQLCQEHPALRSELDRVRAELEPLLSPMLPLELELRREGEVQTLVQVPEGARDVSVPDIAPGRYILSLSTGRVIWEGAILPTDVLWTEAYPGRDVQVAAQTGELGREAARVERLLNGELELRLYPGLESGTMRISKPEAAFKDDG